MLKKTLLAILATAGLLAVAQAQDKPAQATASPKEIAGQCQISLIETPHLKLSRSEGDTDGACFIYLKSKEKVSAEQISLIFAPISHVESEEGDCCIVGFERNRDKPYQWRFVGTKDDC